MDPLLMNYRLAVFSNEPPKYPNVLWICPVDEKHFDVRIYTTILEDEYTSIKKWTSIGISDLELTNLSTDSWYVGTIDEFPVLDIEFSPIEISDVVFESYQVEDIVYIPGFLLNNLINKLDEKKVYFDTRTIDYEKTPHKYYVVVVPLEYKINTIRKDNYYENTKSYHEDVLLEGSYIVKKGLASNGKLYNILFLLFKFEELPFLITTNVVKDLVVSDYIVLETGNSIDKVMSQLVVTKELDSLKDILSNVDVPNLATVAKTGDYNDLLNKPEIPSIEGLATTASVEQSLILSKLYTDLRIGNIEFPEPVKKLSQLENDTNFARGISIVTIHNNEWVDNPDTERWNYLSDYNALLFSIKPNERVIIDSPVSLSGIYILPISEIEAESATYELVFKTSDSTFGIGTLEEIQWAKEPVFNANKTYAVSIELNKVSENTALGLAMYAEFDTLNMEG